MVTGERKKSVKFEIGQEIKQNPDNYIEPFVDDSSISEDARDIIRERQSKKEKEQAIFASEDYLAAEDAPVENQNLVPDIEKKKERIPIITNEPFPELRTLLATPVQTDKTQEHIKIVVTQEVLLETFKHVSTDPKNELGGFLLGNRFQCPNSNRKYIVIDQYLEAAYTEGTSVSLTFKEESFAQLEEFLTGKFRGKELVGWYHSHPNMSIFLSPHDAHIQKSLFPRVWDVALVLDPVKNEGGFFTWSDDETQRLHKGENSRAEFYEWLNDGTQRKSVIAWTNYTVTDPKSSQIVELKEINTGNYRQETAISKNENIGNEQLSYFVNDLPRKVESVQNLIPQKYHKYALSIIVFLAVLASGTFIYVGIKGLRALQSGNANSQPDSTQDNNVNLETDNQGLSTDERQIREVLDNLNFKFEKGRINQTEKKIQIIINIFGKEQEIYQKVLSNLKEHTRDVMINNTQGEITDATLKGNSLQIKVQKQFSKDEFIKYRKERVQEINMDLFLVYLEQSKNLQYPINYSKGIITRPPPLQSLPESTKENNKDKIKSNQNSKKPNQPDTIGKSNESKDKIHASTDANPKDSELPSSDPKTKLSDKNEKRKKGNKPPLNDVEEIISAPEKALNNLIRPGEPEIRQRKLSPTP